MPREVLNRPRRRTAHGEMRTERVPQNMHPWPHTRQTCGAGHAVLYWPARCFIPVRMRVYITVDAGDLDADGGGIARL